MVWGELGKLGIWFIAQVCVVGSYYAVAGALVGEGRDWQSSTSDVNPPPPFLLCPFARASSLENSSFNYLDLSWNVVSLDFPTSSASSGRTMLSDRVKHQNSRADLVPLLPPSLLSSILSDTVKPTTPSQICVHQVRSVPTTWLLASLKFQ